MLIALNFGGCDQRVGHPPAWSARLPPQTEGCEGEIDQLSIGRGNNPKYLRIAYRGDFQRIDCAQDPFDGAVRCGVGGGRAERVGDALQRDMSPPPPPPGAPSC